MEDRTGQPQIGITLPSIEFGYDWNIQYIGSELSFKFGSIFNVMLLFHYIFCHFSSRICNALGVMGKIHEAVDFS